MATNINVGLHRYQKTSDSTLSKNNVDSQCNRVFQARLEWMGLSVSVTRMMIYTILTGAKIIINAHSKLAVKMTLFGPGRKHRTGP